MHDGHQQCSMITAKHERLVKPYLVIPQIYLPWHAESERLRLVCWCRAAALRMCWACTGCLMRPARPSTSDPGAPWQTYCCGLSSGFRPAFLPPTPMSSAFHSQWRLSHSPFNDNETLPAQEAACTDMQGRTKLHRQTACATSEAADDGGPLAGREGAEEGFMMAGGAVAAVVDCCAHSIIL